MRALALLLTLFAAPGVFAQVAIAPAVQPGDAVHRDIVGEIALATGAAHELLRTPLGERELGQCRDDVACLLRLVRDRGGSHLVLVSVAPLGARDQVVAVSLYASATGAKLFEENALLSTTRDVREDARKIGEKVAAIPGLPARVEPAEPPAPEAGPGMLTFAGVTLVGVGAVVVLGTAIASSAMLAGTNPEPRAVGPLIVVGSIAGGGLAAGGLGLMVLDALE